MVEGPDKAEAGKDVEETDEANGKEIKIDSYPVQLGDITFPVNIVDVGDYVPHYNVYLPEIDFVTEALLDETKRSLVSEVQIETRNAMDSGKYAELKDKFLVRSKEKLRAVHEKIL